MKPKTKTTMSTEQNQAWIDIIGKCEDLMENCLDFDDVENKDAYCDELERIQKLLEVFKKNKNGDLMKKLIQ